MGTIESRTVGGAVPGRWNDLSGVGKTRRGVFYALLVGTLGLAVRMVCDLLVMAFIGRFEDFGTHQGHDLVLTVMVWLGIVIPAALLLYRPARRVDTVLAPLLFLVPIAGVAAWSAGVVATVEYERRESDDGRVERGSASTA